MNVNPTPSGNTRGCGPDRLKEPIPHPASRAPGTPTPEPVALPTDRVELSPMARELQQHPAAEGGKILSLSEARVKNVLQRLSAGYYDRPEVREAVLGRIMSDLEDAPTGA